jgi:hypothetical protein
MCLISVFRWSSAQRLETTMLQVSLCSNPTGSLDTSFAFAQDYSTTEVGLFQ